MHLERLANEVPKRSADALETSSNRPDPSNTVKSGDNAKYVCAILVEERGPYRKAEVKLRGVFKNLKVANEEGQAICDDWHLFDQFVQSDDRLDVHDEVDRRLKEDQFANEGGIKVWYTRNGELNVRLDTGEGEYQKMSVIRQRLQSKSKYAKKAMKRRDAERDRERGLARDGGGIDNDWQYRGLPSP